MITLDVKVVLLCAMLVALIILIIYLIMLVKKLFKTVDRLDKVLDDSGVVSAHAATWSDELDGVITDVSSTVSNISHDLNDNSGLIKTATNVGKAASSVVSFLQDKSGDSDKKKRKKEKKEKKEQKVS